MVIKNKKGEVIFDDDIALLGIDDPDLRDAMLEGVVMEGASFPKDFNPRVAKMIPREKA